MLGGMKIPDLHNLRAVHTFLKARHVPRATRSSDSFRKTIEAAEINPRPVFVLGHPRTGTTLLHNLLSQVSCCNLLQRRLSMATWHLSHHAPCVGRACWRGLVGVGEGSSTP